MNDYARATGRTPLEDKPVVDNRQKLRPLDQTEQARAAEARAFVIAHMPELVPLIRELVAAGLMPGWRGVLNCRLTSGKISL